MAIIKKVHDFEFNDVDFDFENGPEHCFWEITPIEDNIGERYKNCIEGLTVVLALGGRR